MTLHVKMRTAATRRRCHLCGHWIRKGKHAIGQGVVGGDRYKFVRFRNRRLCFCLKHDDLLIINAARKYFSAANSRVLFQKSPCTLTEMEYCLIVGLVASGEIDPEVIARKLQRHHETIRKVLRNAGILTRRQGRRTITIDEVLKLLRDHGVTHINASYVGSTLGVNPTTVGRHLHKHELSPIGRGERSPKTIGRDHESANS